MTQQTSKVVGQFGEVRFPITASLILFGIVVFVVFLFHRYPEERELFKFAINCSTLAAGVLSAYYVGQSLLEAVKQKDQGVRGAKMAMAFRFMERWNEPSLAQTKDTFRSIIDSGKAHDAAFVEQELADKDKRIVVVEVLNFFEEVALVANMDVADQDTLKRYFRGALVSYHSTLSPWIQKHRANMARPTMWCEIDTLLTRW